MAATGKVKQEETKADMSFNNKLTAAEFAKFCGTTRDTLLWYDKMGLLKPDVVGDNGYRYYSLTQYVNFDVIKLMKQSGSSLSEIHVLLEDMSKNITSDFFDNRIKILSDQIRKLTMMRHFMTDIKNSILMSETSEYNKPLLVETEPAAMVAVNKIKVENQSYDDSFAEFVKQYSKLRKLYENDASVHNYPLGAVLSLDEFKRGRLEQLYYFFDTDYSEGHTVIKRPGGYAVTICHKGPYENAISTLDIAFRFIKNRGMAAYDSIYEYDMLAFLTNSREMTTFKFIIPVRPAEEQ
jgi:DNA-binding transcriptional MerR regulator/effector-binding domain-containing protein